MTQQELSTEPSSGQEGVVTIGPNVTKLNILVDNDRWISTTVINLKTKRHSMGRMVKVTRDCKLSAS